MAGMTMMLTDDNPPSISGCVEMKTKLGWSVRWCEFTGKSCQFIRSHDKDDRTTRKLSDLRRAKLKLEPGHSSDRYIEVMHARSQEAGVHTLRLRMASAREATVWIQAVQKAQNYQVKRDQMKRVFTITKNTNGSAGLRLRRSVIEIVDVNGPAAAVGVAAGLQIIRVGDSVIRPEDESATANYVRNAPVTFEIEVRTPKEMEKIADLANEHTIARLKLIAMGWNRAHGEFLPERFLKGLIPWINHNLKIMVVLWGWGNTVESRHISIPGAFVDAKTVHKHLDSDSTWLAARECDSSWDSKAVYFAGPSAGPTAGKQRRVLPSEPLSSAGFDEGRGLALHVVSVDSKKHLSDFSSSVEDNLEQSGGDRRKHIPVAEHNRIVAKKNEEISRLRGIIAKLQKTTKDEADVPWDEEEPSVVAELKDKVDAATTLDELESLSIPDEEAGFFTPAGTPVNSDHWRGIDESMMGRASPLDLEQLSVCSSAEWVGPEDGPKSGHGMVEMLPRGHITEMPENSMSEGWAEGWNLRNVGYKKTGEKVPSLDAMYSVAGVDLYKSQNAVKHAAQYMRVPSIDFPANGLPPVVVFNLQLPFCEAPSVWGQADGPTANVIVTFVLKKSAAEAGDTIPAVKLMKEFYSKVPEKGCPAATEPFLGRFKFLVRAEKGVPKAFSRYNGKPVLVTRSGTFYRSDNYLQVDCNLRSWAYTARVALYSLWNAIPQFKLHVGCCVETRDDAENPERIVGCAQISNLQLENAPEWPGDRK